MHEAGEAALRPRAFQIDVLERRLRVGRAARAADERQDELAHADHADVAEPAAKLLRVLKDVRARGERTAACR